MKFVKISNCRAFQTENTEKSWGWNQLLLFSEIPRKPVWRELTEQEENARKECQIGSRGQITWTYIRSLSFILRDVRSCWKVYREEWHNHIFLKDRCTVWGTNRGAQREKREINRYCYLTIQGGHDGVYLLRQVAVVVPARCIKQDFFLGGGT